MPRLRSISQRIRRQIRSWRAAGAAPLDEDEIVLAQIEHCKELHAETDYYAVAEADMDLQWEQTIWQRIQHADFSSVLELAPGHGRNTAKLIPLARSIHLVDVNLPCIEACRKRFGDRVGDCDLRYQVGDGQSLKELADESITFVYSWDSMVHFDRRVMRRYLAEFARVMSPGATGFVHHSNYGTVSDSVDWAGNPSWRSNMTADLFTEYASELGLEVTDQRLLWWFIDDIDCVSSFRRP